MATSSTRSSLAFRLAWRTALWVVLTAATLGGAAAWQYWRVSLRALDQALQADAQALAAEITEQDGLLQVDVSAETRTRLSGEASYYGVYDRDGRPLDGDAPALASGVSRDPGARTQGTHREAWVTGPQGSLVRVGRSLAPLRADLGRLAASLTIAALCALLPAVPLVLWLRRTLTGAFAQFDQTARRLAPGRRARIDPARVDRELVAVATRLNDAFDRLEAGLRREQQLTADASHELRTPVSTILAETEWALADGRTSGEQRASLEACHRQGRRLKALIESLLTLARLESGEVPVARASVDLGDLVDGVLRDLADQAARHDVRLQRRGEARVDGDRMQLDILTRNLVDNAIRHGARGGVVDVVLGATDDGVRLTVQDEGTGIAPADATRVFDRFWRADPSRSSRAGGTGLGLAICKAIVEAHGGAIACESMPSGTAFTAWLPRDASAADHRRRDR